MKTIVRNALNDIWDYLYSNKIGQMLKLLQTLIIFNIFFTFSRKLVAW